MCAGDENGNVFLWKDLESIKNNIGVNLTGHTSMLTRFGLSKDDSKLLTLGQNDQAMLQWKITPVEMKPQTDKLYHNKPIIQSVPKNDK